MDTSHGTVPGSTDGNLLLVPGGVDNMIAMAVIRRVVSILGHNFNIGLSPLQRRARAAALDFKGCIETGILPKDRVESIRTKMDLVIKGQEELDQCKKGLFNKDRRRIIKRVKNNLRDLEKDTSESSTQRYIRQSMGQTNYESESQDPMSAYLELQAAAMQAGVDPVSFAELMRAMLTDYFEKTNPITPTYVTHCYTDPVTIDHYCQRCHPESASTASVSASKDEVETPPIIEATRSEDSSGLLSEQVLDNLAESFVKAVSCTTPAADSEGITVTSS